MVLNIKLALTKKDYFVQLCLTFHVSEIKLWSVLMWLLQCDMAVATKAFFDLTYDNATTDAILFGDACYSVTGPMAEISREWGMFQVNYPHTFTFCMLPQSVCK